jgi:hypothetical protein
MSHTKIMVLAYRCDDCGAIDYSDEEDNRAWHEIACIKGEIQRMCLGCAHYTDDPVFITPYDDAKVTNTGGSCALGVERDREYITERAFGDIVRDVRFACPSWSRT